MAFGIAARSAARESGGGGGSAAGVPTIARSIDRAQRRSKRSGAIEARSRRRRAAKFEGENARSRIGNAGPVRSSVNYRIGNAGPVRSSVNYGKMGRGKMGRWEDGKRRRGRRGENPSLAILSM